METIIMVYVKIIEYVLVFSKMNVSSLGPLE